MRAQVRLSKIFTNLPTDPTQRVLALWLIEQPDETRKCLEAEAVAISTKIKGMGPLAALELIYYLGRWAKNNDITDDSLREYIPEPIRM